jgi:uncharacterized protein Veg
MFRLWYRSPRTLRRCLLEIGRPEMAMRLGDLARVYPRLWIFRQKADESPPPMDVSCWTDVKAEVYSHCEQRRDHAAS